MDIKSYISSGIIEQYVLGTLPLEESSILECVMKHNAEVANAVLDAQKTLEDFSTLQSVHPPSYLKSKISSQLDFNNQHEEEPQVRAINEHLPKKKSNNSLAIAASLLLLISIGWSILNIRAKNRAIDILSQNNDQLKTEIANVQQQNNSILNAENIILEGVEKHSGMLANVYWDSSKRVYLSLGNLPKAPKGKQYQLWALVNGKPVDLGMYDQKKSKKIQTMKRIENAEGFAITLEKEGGSPSPTMEEMYVMGKV